MEESTEQIQTKSKSKNSKQGIFEFMVDVETEVTRRSLFIVRQRHEGEAVKNRTKFELPNRATSASHT